MRDNRYDRAQCYTGNHANIKVNIKAIMESYADNENSKGETKESPETYVNRMAGLFFNALALADNLKLQIGEAILNGDYQKTFYLIGLLATELDSIKTDLFR